MVTRSYSKLGAGFSICTACKPRIEWNMELEKANENVGRGWQLADSWGFVACVFACLVAKGGISQAGNVALGTIISE